MLFFLHGLGDNISNYVNDVSFVQMANQWGWRIVVPQALSVQGYQDYTMWNAGLGLGIGETADDSGFLIALLDTLISHGDVNPDSVFFTGFSMGGFMTHRIAIEHGDRVTACASVSGLIPTAFANVAPVAPVRMLHVHGTADNTVSWEGRFNGMMTVGITVDSIVGYWVRWNGCGTTPTVEALPDTRNDGLSFVRKSYSGGNADFQLLKVEGGAHEWYSNSNVHDIDYFEEIYSFFVRRQAEGEVLGIQTPSAYNFSVWPNPACDHLNVCSGQPVRLSLVDARGSVVSTYSFPQGVSNINLGSLPRGIYLLSDDRGGSVKVVLK